MNASTCPNTHTGARTLGVAVVFTLFVAVVFGFGMYLFALIVPTMRQSLGFEYTAIGAVTGGAQVAYLLAALACPAVHRFGAGQVIVGAVGGAALLLLLFARVQGIVSVGLLLIGLGAAAAFMVVPTVGAIAATVALPFQARVNGLVSSGTAYGQFANGLLVSWLLPAHGWPSVWVAAGLAAMAITLAGWIALRRFAAPVFAREAPRRAERHPAPGGWLRLATRGNLMVWILLALSGMACGPWQNYLSSFLADEQGYPLETIGQLWSIVGVVGLFSGFAAGMAADKAGVRRALAFSYAALACSGLLIAFHSQAWHLQLGAVCFGLSFYAIYGLIPAYISKTAEARSATTVFAIANVFLGVGTTLGNVAGGSLPGWLGSLDCVFLAAAALACVAITLTVMLPDERRLAR